VTAGRYEYDDRNWPILRVRTPMTPPSEETFKEHLARLTGFLRRHEPYAVILDTSGRSTLAAPFREMVRKHRLATYAEAAIYQRAAAFVVGSVFERAVLTAILTMSPAPYPSRVFDDIDLAEAWVTKYLDLRSRLRIQAATPHEDRQHGTGDRLRRDFAAVEMRDPMTGAAPGWPSTEAAARRARMPR
jgi:hypothetical protein